MSAWDFNVSGTSAFPDPVARRSREKNHATPEPLSRDLVFIFAKAATPPRLEAGDSQPAAFAPPFVDANSGGPVQPARLSFVQKRKSSRPQ
jgi:hypothetical protein